MILFPVFQDHHAAAPFKRSTPQNGTFPTKLGILAGIDEATASARMNQYERGIHTPDFALACRLAEVLKIPACYFYTVEDDLAEVVAGWYQR